MSTKDIRLIESYYKLLKNLSPEYKLELISRLTNSLKINTKEKEYSLSSLYGSLKTEESADELIDRLKTERNFINKREEL